MKKNKALTAAFSVFALTMVSMCAIGGTFAKYAAQGSGNDSATVAAWGIELTVSGDNALYDDSKSGDEVTAKAVTENTKTAPGTYQKLATVELTGTPEVAYEITVNANLDLGDKWVVDGDVYCPLVFTVGGTPYEIDGINITTTAELEAAVEKAIIIAIAGGDGLTNVQSYDAGVAVPTSANEVLIDWTWAFDGDSAKDTKLGTAANASVKLDLTVKVEQVD